MVRFKYIACKLLKEKKNIIYILQDRIQVARAHEGPRATKPGL